MTDPYTVDWSAEASHLGHAAVHGDRGWTASVARTLVRATDRVAVDVGCGGAGMTIELLAALPAGARVVAVDGSEDVLAVARRNVGDSGGRVEFVVADLDGDLSEVPGPADLVWASASVHHAGDQQAAVNTLAGLLAPGGRLALAEGGLPARHLPWDLGVGEPGLEIRLHAAQDRWFGQMRARLPGSVPMPYGWTEALGRAGLTPVASRSTLIESPVPLSEERRHAVAGKLAHHVERLRPSGLLDADLPAWDRLLDPGSPDWLGARPDLFHLEARTVHVGTRG